MPAELKPGGTRPSDPDYPDIDPVWLFVVGVVGAAFWWLILSL